MESSNIKQIIENWYTYKRQHDELEKRIDRCKEIIKNYMDENQVNAIVSDKIVVKRAKHTRESLDRNSVPTDIWNKYQKKSEYWMYKITERN